MFYIDLYFPIFSFVFPLWILWITRWISLFFYIFQFFSSWITIYSYTPSFCKILFIVNLCIFICLLCTIYRCIFIFLFIFLFSETVYYYRTFFYFPSLLSVAISYFFRNNKQNTPAKIPKSLRLNTNSLIFFTGTFGKRI